MNNELPDNPQHYRVEFNLQAPDADWEPSRHFLMFDNVEVALACVQNPPTHISEEYLNYNTINLLLIEYDHNKGPGYWEVKEWVANKHVFHYDNRHDEHWQDTEHA